jgi:hypothetical protein
MIGPLSGMPQMRAAFSGWMQPVKLRRVTQSVCDGLVTDNIQDIIFRGTIQPLSPKQIALKPDGQRAWEWLQIHCLESIADLNINDRIVFNGKFYKIMGQFGYSLNNYIEYHCVRDYQDGVV